MSRRLIVRPEAESDSTTTVYKMVEWFCSGCKPAKVEPEFLEMKTA